MSTFYISYRINQKGHSNCKQLKQGIQQYKTAKLELILPSSRY